MFNFPAVLLALVLYAAPALAQEAAGGPASGHAPDSVEELANALMRGGALSQPDWWKIMSLRGAETKPAAVEPAKDLPAAAIPPVVPTTPPPAPPVCPPPAPVVAPAPLPAPVPAPVPSVILGKDVTMKITGLSQFRYTYAQAAAHATNSSAFNLKTTRLKFAGDLPKNFKYSAQLAFDRLNTSTAQVNSALYDYTLVYALGPKFNLTFGQFTVPVGAEVLTPLDQLDFAARYYAQDRMLSPAASHDTGLMVSGKTFKQRLQYYAGAFNGKGPNYSDNDNDKFLYAGRLAWTAFKGKLSGKDSSFIIGGSALGESTRADAGSLRTDAAIAFTRAYRRYVYGGDLALRIGRAALGGEYIGARLDGSGADPEVNAYGWHATAAYRLAGEKVELLARWQGYDPNTAHRTSKDIKWTTLGLNWFINGNNARVLANYTFKNESIREARNNEFITQLQLSF